MQATLKRFTMLFVTLAAFAAALLFIPTLKASAFTQSVTIGVDQVKSLTDNQYSEGTKQWIISDETILGLVNGQGTGTIVVKGLKTGSTSVICKTYYTEWTTKYDSALGIWVPTTQQGMVYSTFNVTVTETASQDTEITFSDALLNADTDEDGNVTLVSGARRVLLTSTVSESLEWTSSNANVVDVDKMGCIIAVKPGTATITITDPVYGTASKKVTVISPEQAGYTPISTLDELKAISGVSGNYYLTNDIDFGGTSASIKLEGKFDGQGHTISGFVSDSALFNSNGKQVFIENLTMKDCSVVSDGSSAILLNVPSSSSENFIINCHVVGGSVCTDCDAAGIVCSYACTGDCTLGHSVKNNILLCTNNASVEGKQRVGGVASFNHGQIVFCENSGDISIKSGTQDTKGYCSAGGILGSDYMHWTGTTANRTYYASTRIIYCTNKGQISGLVAGGIAGSVYGTRIVRSTNYGTVKTDTTVKPYSSASGYGAYSLVGGITGRMSYGYGSAFSMIMYCANKGSVLADDSSGVKFCSGGIAGYAYLNGNFGNIGTPIQHCFTAKGGDYVNKYSGYSYTGGIIAALSGSQYTNYVATYSYAQGSSIVTTSGGTGCSYLYSDNLSYASKADIMTITSSKLYNPNNDWTAVEDDYPVLTMEVNGEYGSKILNRITYNTAGCTYADGEYIKAYYSDGTSYKLPELSSPCGFVGWYTDSAYTNKIEFISPAFSGDLTLYAKFTHDYGDLQVTKSATCTANGSGTRKCKNCDNIKTEVISALGHSYSAKVVAPTCTEQGYTLHTCSRCSTSYKDTNTSAKGHSYGAWTTIKAATCTATGTQTRKCSCGVSETKTVSALGHNYVTTVVKPTYTAKGYTLHKCSRCGNSYKDTYTDKLVVPTVSGLKCLSKTNVAVTLRWTKNTVADGYILDRYDSANSKWVTVKKITSNATTSYTVTGLRASTTNKFRIKAYKSTASSSFTYLNVNTRPYTTTGLSVSSKTNVAITLKWNKNISADGYVLDKYDGTKWVTVKKITSNATTSYTVTGLKASTTYKFRLKAYKMYGTAYESSAFSYINVNTRPYTTTGFKISSTTKTTIKMQWNKNISASGYCIEKWNGSKWVQIKRFTSNANVSYTVVSGLKANTSYKFRLRAYKTIGTVNEYSAYTQTLTAKTKA